MNKDIEVKHGEPRVVGKIGNAVTIVTKPSPLAGPSPYLSSEVLRRLEEATQRAAAVPAPSEAGKGV